jgi:hypothetical protein
MNRDRTQNDLQVSSSTRAEDALSFTGALDLFLSAGSMLFTDGQTTEQTVNAA